MSRVLIVLDAAAHLVASIGLVLQASCLENFVFPTQALKKAFILFSQLRPNRFNEKILKKISNLKFRKYKKKISGEMESQEAQGDVIGITTDQKSNVALVTPVGDSAADPLPTPKVDNEFRCLSAPRSVISEKTFTDRWFTLKSGRWKKSSAALSRVFSLDLPKDFLENNNARNSPNFAPFSNHTYWRGNMKIRVLVNSNARQFGQLQVKFYYGSHLDEHYEHRDNVFTGSQQPHCLITANASNSGILTIPFEYLLSVINIRQEKTSVYPNAIVGQLVARIIVPLTSNDKTQSFCTWSVAIAFEECEFSGMVDKSLIEGQMFSTAAMLSAMALSETFLDNNRDQPTMSYTGGPVYPLNTGSWCVGTGLAEWSNVLRLDPKSVLPYPPTRVPEVDEMQVNYVTKIFGLITTVEWNAQQAVGAQLYAIDASPLLKKEQYPTTMVQREKCIILPPVSVISSLYAYWRGSLELRIDVVGCVELSGRILVAYAPRVKDKLSFNQALNCSHAIFDLQENRQFIFEIPFVSDRLFWPRRTNISPEYVTNDPPGKVFIYVYNDLIANETIPSECQLVIYLRGGDTFEVSVPASPSVGLCFEPNIYISTDTENKAWLKQGYGPAYVSFWRGWAGNVEGTNSWSYGPILRYGDITDHIVQIDTVGKVYHTPLKPIEVVTGGDWTMTGMLWFPSGGGQMVKNNYWFSLQYIVLLQQGDYTYAVPFADIRAAEIFAKSQMTVRDWIVAHKDVLVDVTLIGQQGKWKIAGIESWFDNNMRVTNGAWLKPDYPSFAPVPHISGEMDERKKTVIGKTNPQQSVCYKTSASQIIFGEKFKDLKDYARRYQRYATGKIGLNGARFPEEFQMVILKFPAMPQGLALDIGTQFKINEYWNRTRDGPIPIIASGYRFFTGGLRFRIVLHFDNDGPHRPHNMKISVQHRPNITTLSEKVEITQSNYLGSDDLELPGYATHIQQDDMNSIVSIEVPFYMPSVRGLLQRPKATQFAHVYSSLGEIALGIQVDKKESGDLVYDIYYSISDDARFSVFQGFPPLIEITSIPNVKDKKSITSAISEAGSSFADITEVIDEEEEAPVVGEMAPPNGEMFGLGFFSKASGALDVINDEKTKTLLENVSDIADKFKNTMTEIPDMFTSMKFNVKKYVDILINAVTNLVHCILSFKISTVTVALISFFTQLKLVSYSTISKLMEWGQKLIAQLINRGSNKPNEEPIQGEMESEVLCGYVSTLIAGVASAMGVAANFSKNSIMKLGAGLTKGLREFSMTANSLFTFLKNNIEMLQSIGRKLFNRQPKIAEINFLEEHEDGLYEWAKTAIKLTDPSIEDSLFEDHKKAQEVFVCANQACLFQLRILALNIHLNNAQNKVIEKLIANTLKLRDRLIKRHISPPVRFEPYSYEISGGAGLGKSYLLQTLPVQLLDHIKYKHYGRIIYDRANGNRYWNGLRSEPVVNYDDKWAITGPEFADVQLAELFQLKTRAVFNPPQAALEDKERTYSPVIMQCATNCAFPKLMSVLDETAVFRRRDDLIRIRRNPTLEREYGKFTIPSLKKDFKKKTGKEINLTNFSHLQFSFAIDPSDRKTLWGGWLNYTLFRQALCERFQKYYEKEMELYKSFSKSACQLYPTDPEVALSEDHYSKWIKSVESDVLNLTEEQQALKAKVKSIYKENKHEPKIQRLAKSLLTVVTDAFSSSGQDPCTSGYVPAFIPTKDEDIPLDECGEPSDNEEEPILTEDPVIGEMALEKIKKMSYCPHEFLHIVVHGDSEYIDFDYETASWHVEEEFFMRRFAYDCQIKYKKCFSKVTYEHRPHIKIPHEQCSVDPNSCPHKEAENRRRLVFKYIDARQDLRVMKECGASMTHMFPSETFAATTVKPMTPEEVENKVGWLRGFWGKLKSTIMSWPWKKFFNIIKLILAFLVPLGYCFGWEMITAPGKRLQSAIEHQRHINMMKFDNMCREHLEHKEPGHPPEFVNKVVEPHYNLEEEKKNNPYYKAVEFICSKPIFPVPKENIVPEGHVSGDHKTIGIKKSPVVLANKLLEPAQGQMSEEQFASVSNLITRNTFLLQAYVLEEDGSVKSSIAGRCLGIKGQWALIVDHYYEAFQTYFSKFPECKLSIINSMIPACVNVDKNLLTYYKFENSSLGMIKFENIPAFKNLVRQIAPRAYHGYLNNEGSMVEIVFRNGKPAAISNQAVRYFLRGVVEAEGDELYGNFKTGSSYQYDSFTGKGKCGSVLLALNIPCPLVGVHVAGNGSIGFSEAIYREMFEDLDGPSATPIGGEGECSKWYIDAQVFGVGKVSAKLAHRESKKSRIVPSEVQLYSKGEFPVYSDVAILSPSDPRNTEGFSPMLEGCKHHGHPMKTFDMKDFALVEEDVNNLLLSKCVPCRKEVGVLSVDEACGGIPYLPGYESLEWRTSEGFPFAGLRPAGEKDKRWLFNMSEDNLYQSVKPLLARVLEQKHKQRMNDEIPATVFTDCLKDCTIDLEKVLVPGKTRVFSMAPVDFTIQQRQYTMDFAVAYMKNRLDLEHAVGINPDSVEWTHLAEKLLKIGNKIITGDFSKFGDRIPPYIIQSIFKVLITNWYQHFGATNPEIAQILKIMSYELSHSLHLMFDFLYQVVCGQPSGNSLTVIFNSLCNSYYFRLAWLKIMKSTQYSGLDHFGKMTCLFSYGDDVIMSVADEVADLFNAQTLCEFFASYDLKFTNADKSDTIIPHVNLGDADFLKRGFRLHPIKRRANLNIMLAPLKPQSIEDTVNWVWSDSFGRSAPGTPTFREMCLQVCEDATRNAFGRGPEYYGLFCKKLSKFWVKRGVHTSFPTWEQLDNRVFDLEENINKFIHSIKILK